MSALPAKRRQPSIQHRIERTIEGRYWAYLLILPSLILVAAVVVYPVIDGICSASASTG